MTALLCVDVGSTFTKAALVTVPDGALLATAEHRTTPPEVLDGVAGDQARRRVLTPAVADHAGGWPVPERARTAVDVRYVLFAAGLLAADHPAAACALVGRLAAVPR
jgi:hypothetical protein